MTLAFGRGGRRAPGFLWIPALAVAAVSLAPVYYLAVRSTERGWEPWREVAEQSLWPLLVDSLQLAGLVVACSLAIALPAAWLTGRTDLPGRRAWAVGLALPLAIPSYVMGLAVVAALGPRGLLQDWLEPLGVERLPEIYGLPAATLTLTAVTYTCMSFSGPPSEPPTRRRKRLPARSARGAGVPSRRSPCRPSPPPSPPGACWWRSTC